MREAGPAAAHFSPPQAFLTYAEALTSGSMQQTKLSIGGRLPTGPSSPSPRGRRPDRSAAPRFSLAGHHDEPRFIGNSRHCCASCEKDDRASASFACKALISHSSALSRKPWVFPDFTCGSRLLPLPKLQGPALLCRWSAEAGESAKDEDGRQPKIT